jgi:hypothetical protein
MSPKQLFILAGTDTQMKAGIDCATPSRQGSYKVDWIFDLTRS